IAVASIDSDEPVSTARVLLERLETGSLGTELRSIPPAVWAKVTDIIRYAINPASARLADLKSGLELSEQIHDLLAGGKITPEIAEEFMRANLDANRLLANQHVNVLEIDEHTEKVKTSDKTGPKTALGEVRRPRALPPASNVADATEL